MVQCSLHGDVEDDVSRKVHIQDDLQNSMSHKIACHILLGHISPVFQHQEDVYTEHCIKQTSLWVMILHPEILSHNMINVLEELTHCWYSNIVVHMISAQRL